MREVDENLKPFADDFVTLLALDVRDQPHAAGIVLIARMIEALRLRRAETAIQRSHGVLCEQLFVLRQPECCEVHIHSAILSTKIALPVDREIEVSRAGRIPELRCF
jgi:hypothetical protein